MCEFTAMKAQIQTNILLYIRRQKMGKIIHFLSVSGSEYTGGLLKPIIYCCQDKAIVDSAVSLNQVLAQKLLALRPKRRTIRLATCFEEILKTLPDNVIIKDFDVMFNPEYKVDVLKIMVDACKRKPFSIIWPGKCENGKLFYAEDSFPDFKSFSVEDYDVTCIIQGGRKT